MGADFRSYIVAAILFVNCMVAEDESEPESAPEGETHNLVQSLGCSFAQPGVYSPFADDEHHLSGDVATFPWRAPDGENDVPSGYPDGIEDFSAYGKDPTHVECGSDKQSRSYLDVTAGCLDSMIVEGTSENYSRGVIRTTEEGYFRALALAYAPSDPTEVVKWTDQGIRYRFLYKEQTGQTGNPGFKAFVRYRSENDLYVASWRFDGVVQIQRKFCDTYIPLAVLHDFGPPAAQTWHSIQFEALGQELFLYLDGKLVLKAHSGTFSWGTAGIRIDSADNAFIDDWEIFEPR